MPESNPDTPQTIKKRGDEFLKIREYNEAIRCYLRAVELDPFYSQAWNNLGYAYVQLGQKEDALHCIIKKKELEAVDKNRDFKDQLSGEINPIPFREDDELPVPPQPDGNFGHTLDLSAGAEDNEPGSVATIEMTSRPPGLHEEPGNEYRDLYGQNLDTTDVFKKIIFASMIIGLCLMGFLLILGSSGERYTQFYVYPDSIQTASGSLANTSSFVYGVKSFERDTIEYQLIVYDESELVDMETFTLGPGETREREKSFDYTGLVSDEPKKINIFLKSPSQTYDLHYWIKK